MWTDYRAGSASASKPRTADRLIVTRQFALRHAALPAFSRKRCERVLRKILTDSLDPTLRVRGLVSPADGFELHFGYQDRAIFKEDDRSIILLDAAGFREIARLNTLAARRLRPYRRMWL